jgi:hypothetical protein
MTQVAAGRGATFRTRLARIRGRVVVLGALVLVVLAERQPRAAASLAAPIDGSEPPVGELWVQNLNPVGGQDSVSVAFYARTGRWPFPAVLLPPPPRSADIMRTGQLAATLPVGQFAAHLISNNAFPSVAVVREEWPASGGAALYDAIPGSAEVIVPWVARRKGVAAHSSRVAVQDTAITGEPQAVEVRFTQLGAVNPTLTVSRTIPAGTASVFDLARDADLAALPDGFAGVMRVKAAGGRRIAVAATTELANSSQAVYATSGADIAKAGPRLAAPRVTRRRSETRGDGGAATTDSFIVVANVGQATANVSVRYFGSDEPGNACAGQTIVHGGTPVGIAPGGGALFAQGTEDLGLGSGSSGLPDNCVATAVIESDGPPIAATVVELEDDGARAGAYSAVSAGVAEREAFIPLFRKSYDDLSTSLHVMNAGDATSLVQVRVTFVADSSTRTATLSRSLAPGASARWDAAQIAEMPGGTFGGVAITGSRAGTPIVAVARETSDDGRIDNALYTGLVKPAVIDHPFPQPSETAPYYAPSIWNSRTHDLGLLVPGTTQAEIDRVSTVLNDQAFDFARATGYSIAVTMVPYVINGLPFTEWLEHQVASGFPDVAVRARTWVVGINYNTVVVLGQQGSLVPLDRRRFPDRGDFIEDAWNLNFVGGSDRPLAVPWMRAGCTPTYRNLGLVAGSRNDNHGFRLMEFMTQAARQRENYAPTRPQRTQIGYPTLTSLYAELGIQCPASGPLILTPNDDVGAVLTQAGEDAAQLAAVFDQLDVDVYGDAANTSKAVGASSGGFDIVAQPMVNTIPSDELRDRLASAAGLVVGTLSLHAAPTPTPTDMASDTPAPISSATPLGTATPTPPDRTPGPGGTDTPPPTATATVVRTGTPTGTGTATATAAGTATATAVSTAAPTQQVILLPYAAKDHGLRGGDGSMGDRAGAASRRPRLGVDGKRQEGPDQAYVVVWRQSPGGQVVPVLVDADGQTVDPASVGIELPPVGGGFQGGSEPEAWSEHGSVVICVSVDQYKGCLSIDR